MFTKLESIPAHVRYPGLVLAFLLLSVAGQVVLVSSAFRDGGPQIEPDYYAKAVGWDAKKNQQLAFDRRIGAVSLMVKARQNEVVIMQLSLDPHPSITPAKPTRVVGHRPSLADVQFEGEPKLIHSTGTTTRRAHIELPSPASGLWDFRVTWQHPTGVYTTMHRIEL